MKLIGICNVEKENLAIFFKLGERMRPTTIVRDLRAKMIEFYCL